MRPFHLVAPLLAVAALAGCGRAPGLPAPGHVVAGVGVAARAMYQLDQAELHVPGPVFGYARDFVERVTREYERDNPRPDLDDYLFIEANLTASPDGFKTRYGGDRPIRLRVGDPLLEGKAGLTFALRKAPAGEMAYFLTVTATYRYKTTLNRTFAPLYINDFGRNFRGVATRRDR
jgi:hypothetical protein